MRPAIAKSICAGTLVAALAISACGGGDDAGTSKDEFIFAADEICARGDAAIDAKALEFSAAAPDDDRGLVETVIVPGLRSELNQLRDLELPEADRAGAVAFLNGLERGTVLLEANPEQLTEGRAASTFLKARRQAKEFGMEACARGAA